MQERKKWFYGYKTHVSLNQKTGLTTSVLVSTGRSADCTASTFLLSDDMKKGVKPTVVTADKAYDDSELQMFCGKHEIFNAVALKDTRTNCKNPRIRPVAVLRKDRL
ncbi:MAG: transposase [Armatimonadetes bacterium]|nr:transposase [Armatimonadota bacterium]